MVKPLKRRGNAVEKNKHKLKDEELKELEKIIGEITEEAKKVVEDYVNNPSEMSGSITNVHQNSPILNEKNVGKKKKN